MVCISYTFNILFESDSPSSNIFLTDSEFLSQVVANRYEIGMKEGGCKMVDEKAKEEINTKRDQND